MILYRLQERHKEDARHNPYRKGQLTKWSAWTTLALTDSLVTVERHLATKKYPPGYVERRAVLGTKIFSKKP